MASEPRLADRRVVTVLFADIAGFTALSERYDPEVVRALIAKCFGRLIERAQDEGGWVEKHIGDAILAVFGAPRAHEDDPARAVRAAFAMQEQMHLTMEELRLDGLPELRLRIGVDTGLVVMGSPVSEGLTERDLWVNGDAVNTAKRFQEAAGPGRILVSESTYRATQRVFDYEDRPAFEAKGKQEPLSAYEPIGARSAEGGIVSPLVGRDRELAVLEGCVDRLVRGEGGVAVVSGAPGLGKSRLVAELRRRTAGRDVRLLEGRAIPFGSAISYWPFVEIVRHDAGIIEEDGEDESWLKLERRVSELFPEDADKVLPYLGSLSLGRRDEFADRVRHQESDALGGEIFRASLRLFERLAAEQPLVLVFEDWHWADASSVALLEHLFPLVRRAQLLICCVVRTGHESSSPWEEQKADPWPESTTRVDLVPLSTADSAQLVCNLLELDALPAPLREALYARTEGNPFFIEEIVRTLIEIGAIARDSTTDSWAATVPMAEIALPDTLVGVVMARVDRLDEEQKEVLRLAAVIGRTFYDRVLRAVSGESGSLGRILDELRDLDLIEESSGAREREYAFKHAVIRDVVYESILLSRRAELHGRVGACLESLFAGRLEEVYSLVAYHFAQAKDGERALDYLLKAGDLAAAMASDTEALAHYRQANDEFLRGFGASWKPVERARLERKMGEAFSRRSDHADADVHFQRSLLELGSPYPEPAPSSGGRIRRALTPIRLALAWALLCQIGHRLAAPLVVRKPTAAVDPIVEERTANYHSMSWMHYFTDREMMCLDAVLQLNASERSGYALGMARGYDGLGIICDVIPLKRVAGRYHSRAIRAAAEIDAPGAIGLANLGLCAHEQSVLGEWDLAVEHAELAAAKFGEAGDLRGSGVARRMLCGFLACQGELARSVAVAREIVREARDTGHKQVLGWGPQGLKFALLRAGELEEAQATIEECIPILEEVPDHRAAVMAKGDLAQSWLELGEVDRALEELEEARERIAKYMLRGFSCTPVLNATAEVYLARAERDGAPLDRRFFGTPRRALRNARWQGRWLDTTGQPGAYRLMGTYWWLCGKQRRARKWWDRSLECCERLGARYDTATTLRERGRRTGSQADLERADAIFAEIRRGLDAFVAEPPAEAAALDRATAAF
ncbi:MAG: ATP-binding protein [Gaiellaceae bacterium]